MYFLELSKKVGHSFEVKISDLSIYEAFREIPALLRHQNTTGTNQPLDNG